MTNPACDHRLSAWRRIRHQRDFDRIYAAGCRASDSSLLVFADVGQDCRGTRIGLSVSKKHGNAVSRNRLKRLLREAFRLQQADIPEGLDLVLIPRQASDPTLGQFQASLLKLSSKVSSKLSGRESEGSR